MTFIAKILCVILVVLVPFTVVGLETSNADGGLVPAIGDDIMKEGSRPNLRVAMAASSSKTIVELAVRAKPEFETLVAALTAAELVDALSGAGPFTVFGELVIALIPSRFDFNRSSKTSSNNSCSHTSVYSAPTDASFAALPAGTLDSLLEPGNIGSLQDILKYHVVSGKYEKCDFKVGVTTLTTLNGDQIKVTKTRYGRVSVNGIRASLPEIKGSNGVIYKINGVLIPP